MINVLTLIGTRPEIIRLSRVIHKLDKYPNHLLVHTGQNYDYELNEIFFNDLDIRKPDIFLEAAGKNAAETIGNVIKYIDGVFDEHNPDALLILGDTNSSLAAIPAKRRKIPIFHMEAGNRCFDYRVPEEINRKIVDHISDINLTYSDIARDYLISENFPPDQIIKTGSPMKEVLDFYSSKIKSSKILKEIKLKSNDYFLCSFHREENVDDPKNLQKIINIMNSITEKYSKTIIVSTHPRTQARLEKANKIDNSLIKYMKPFGFSDYIHLQLNAVCVLSDSGTITEESSILNFSALNIREVNERPEGFEEGAVMMTSLDEESVLNCLNIIKDQGRDDTRSLNIVQDYDVSNVSDKVIRIISSYINFVNKKVWKK